MGFDLALWYEASPISHREATEKYGILLRNEDVGLAEYPGLAVIYADLTTRYPAPNSVVDMDHSETIWSAEPRIVANAVRLSIAIPAVARVSRDVQELAEREGVVCFDPQRGRVRLPSAMRLLQLYGGVVEAVTEPSLELVAQAVAQTASARSHLVLERGTELYVQVGPALHGTFGVEYRDGGPERHFRYETSDLSEVRNIFDSYARGAEGWRQYGWDRLQL